MKLTFKLSNGNTVDIDVAPNDTWIDAKMKIHQQDPFLHPNIQQIILRGRVRGDQEIIANTKIRDGSVITVELHLDHGPPLEEHLQDSFDDNIILWAQQYWITNENLIYDAHKYCYFNEKLQSITATDDFSIAKAGLMAELKKQEKGQIPYLAAYIISKQTLNFPGRDGWFDVDLTKVNVIPATNLHISDINDKRHYYPLRHLYMKSFDAPLDEQVLPVTCLFAGFFTRQNEFMLVDSPCDYFRNHEPYTSLRTKTIEEFRPILTPSPTLDAVQQRIQQIIEFEIEPVDKNSAHNQALADDIEKNVLRLLTQADGALIVIDPNNSQLSKFLLTFYNDAQNYLASQHNEHEIIAARQQITQYIENAYDRLQDLLIQQRMRHIRFEQRKTTASATASTAATVTTATKKTPAATATTATPPTETSTTPTKKTPAATTAAKKTPAAAATATTAAKKTPAATATTATKKTPAATATTAAKKTPAATATTATQKTPAATATTAAKNPPTETSTTPTKKTPAATATTAAKKTPAATATTAAKKTPAATATTAAKKTPAATATTAAKKTPAATATTAAKKTPAATATTAATISHDPMDTIKTLLKTAVDTYNAKILRTEDSNHDMPCSSQGNGSSSSFFSAHGLRGSYRANDFLERIDHQTSVEKMLNVILHLFKNEGGKWSPDSLKPSVIAALANQQIGAIRTPPCPVPLDQETGIRYINNLHTQLNNNQAVLDTSFDEIPRLQGFFSFLYR